MQSVLILGAGLLQRPAIMAAKRLGYRAVVVDGNERAVCAPLADEFHHIDLKDKEGILTLAMKIAGVASPSSRVRNDGVAAHSVIASGAKQSLAAVFTAGTDFSASAAYVTEALGLPGHSYEAAMNASDKGRMRECFRRAGVPSPRFCVIGDSNDISIGCHGLRPRNDGVLVSSSKKAEDSVIGGQSPTDSEATPVINYPCVAKPVDNMGARGCRMVRSADEAEKAIRDAISSSRTGRAIIEEYMDGPEYSIDALVFDGEVTVTGFADRHIYWPPYFIETGHTMPTDADDGKKAALIETFARGIAALGLTHGAAKADIKWTSRGPMVGEIAARLSGGYMSGWTFPYASGLDLTEQALLAACGERPQKLLDGRVAINKEAKPFAIYDYPCNAVCAERAWVSIPGTVAEVVGVDDITNQPVAECFCSHNLHSLGQKCIEATPAVKDVFPRAAAGDEADFPRNNVQKCGNVIAVAPTRKEAVQAAENAAAGVVVVLEPHNPRTEKFLSERTDFPPSAYQVSDEVWDEVAHMGGVLRPGDKATECVPECLMAMSGSSSADHPVVECFLPPSCAAPLDKKCIETTTLETTIAPDAVDFNRRTLKDTLVLFDKISSCRTCDVPLGAFWSAVLRGGVQGALYIAGENETAK